MSVAMCAPVVQGYGLTETSAGSFIAPITKPECSGTVGACLPSIEFMLEAVPEMNYYVDKQGSPISGEVCIRGP